jgi:endonuclease YncB( thermonuclease family)
VSDVACPRCGVPLHDQPDYCWSCGFYVGDRWRTTQLTEGDGPEPRVVGPDDATTDVRSVGDESPKATLSPGNDRWIVPVVALAALVILVLLAIALFGGKGPGAATGTPTAVAAGAVTAPSIATDVSASAFLVPTGRTTDAVVRRVVDGDTIVADIAGESVRVRYIGMDTPESVQPDTPVEPLSLEAAAANRELVEGHAVLLERDVSDTDRYGRLLRNVWVERDGRQVMAGLELVRAGMALVTTYPPDVRYVDALVDAQAQARADRLGIWSD